MGIIVQKFGGTSVANLDCMRKVQAKVEKALASGHKVMAVLSAMSGETNRLLALAKEWSSSPDPAEMDSLVSTGEQASTALFTMLLKDSGIKARSILSHQAQINTDSQFGRARILNIDKENLLKLFEKYDVLVVAGFQGVNEDGRITTLGRGGSDTSAVALAVAVDAELCEIYTDVDGVYTTDPNIVTKAKRIPKITYDEMLELASMGAKVLQTRSVEFAKKYNMTVHVLSTFVESPGTLVTQEDESMEAVLVSGIAYDKDQVRVTILDVYDKPGIASSLFAPLADAGVVVDMIIQNTSRDGHKTDMTFTVPRGDLEKTMSILDGIKETLGGGEVLYDEDVAKVSAIGVGMRTHSGVASTMFTALHNEGINILMISTSEIKVTCLIEEKYTELAMRTLHDAFELEKDGIRC